MTNDFVDDELLPGVEIPPGFHIPSSLILCRGTADELIQTVTPGKTSDLTCIAEVRYINPAQTGEHSCGQDLVCFEQLFLESDGSDKGVEKLFGDVSTAMGQFFDHIGIHELATVDAFVPSTALVYPGQHQGDSVIFNVDADLFQGDRLGQGYEVVLFLFGVILQSAIIAILNGDIGTNRHGKPPYYIELCFRVRLAVGLALAPCGGDKPPGSG